jgi:trimeric autotransporter adhesin
LNFDGALNSFFGRYSGFNSQGDQNCFFGAFAGSENLTGRNLICIGAYSQPSTDSTNHEITLGNDSVQILRCNATSITSLSDKRDKTDIQDLSLGIDFVMTLRPRQYHWDRRDWYTDKIPDGTQKDSEFTAGFIAQELDQAQISQEAEWLNLVMKNNPERLEATPGNLLPVIVKSLQDLKRENDQLKLYKDSLEQSVEILKAEIEKMKEIIYPNYGSSHPMSDNRTPDG